MRRTTSRARTNNSLATIAFFLFAVSVAQSALPYTGINISGGEWQDGPFWPNAYEIDYFVSRGMNIFRLPFKWEKLQPTLSGEFDAKFWSGYLSVINYITVTKGMTVIIDPHNYARYNGNIVGAAGGTPLSALTNLWTRLASAPQLKSNAKVLFGLMNEPYSMSTVTWANNANATIKAIRDTGANNLLLVPGNGFTGSSGWTSTYYDTATPAVSNGDALKNIYDPLNNYAFEVHTYFDKDRGGGVPECEAAPTAPTRFQTVTDWMRANKRRVFLGEFGGSSQTNCLTAFRDAITFLEANSDVWMGWTFWASGSHFASAFLSGEPVGYPPYTTPQITAILPYVKNAVVAKTYPNITPTSWGCTSGASQIVYDDALRNSWQNWSWATNSFTSTRSVSGTAISFTPSSWAAIYLYQANPIPLSAYNAIEFYVAGDSPYNQVVEFSLAVNSSTAGASQPISAYIASRAISSTYTKVVIPFEVLGLAKTEYINGMGFADASGITQTNVYLDNVRLVCTTITGGTIPGNAATPVATPVAAPVRAPVATPVATPVAAPVRAPVATPVAAPVRAPVATPVAAPVRAPVAAPVATPASQVPTVVKDLCNYYGFF